MIPKTALTTGELLEWQLENIGKLLTAFENHYGTPAHNDYNFWGCLHEQLQVNQKHVKQSLKLRHFFLCKDGKPLNITEESFYLESPENQKAFEKAENEVLFDYKKEDAFYQAEKWIGIYDTIEDYIKEENPAITDNYYSKTFN